MDKAHVEQIVHQAIDATNSLLLDSSQLSKRPDTALLGEGADLDSMGFINFVVALEDGLAQQAGLKLSVVEELQSMVPEAQGPSTVADFVDFVYERVRRAAQDVEPAS